MLPSRTWAQRLVVSSFRSTAIRVSLIALVLVGIAMIPVPLRLRTPATLEPVEQSRYFAPSDARIKSVLVDYGDRVQPGQILLELEDRNLATLLDDATANHIKSTQRIHEIELRLLREDHLQASARHELEPS